MAKAMRVRVDHTGFPEYGRHRTSRISDHRSFCSIPAPEEVFAFTIRPERFRQHIKRLLELGMDGQLYRLAVLESPQVDLAVADSVLGQQSHVANPQSCVPQQEC